MEVEVLGVGAMGEEVQLGVVAAEVAEVCIFCAYSVVHFLNFLTYCCSLVGLVGHMFWSISRFLSHASLLKGYFLTKLLRLC